MSTPNLATSIVGTGPNDDLVAVDAYKATPQTTLSRLSTTVESGISSIGDSLKKSNLKVGDIANVITIKDGGIGISEQAAGARADQVAGQNISGIFGTNPSLKQTAISNILGITGNSRAQRITNAAGDTLRIVDGADTTRARGITQAISSLFKDTPLSNYADDNSVLGTALAYLGEAVELGIVDAIDIVMDKVKTDKMSKQQLIDSTLLIVARADLPTLNKIMDWIGPEGVLFKVPNAIGILLAAYRFPFNSSPDQYPGYKTELLATLNRLKPGWDKTTRGTEVLWDYSVFYQVGSHAKLLLLLNDDVTYVVPTLAAPQFPLVDLYQLSQKNYPRMAVWE